MGGEGRPPEPGSGNAGSKGTSGTTGSSSTAPVQSPAPVLKAPKSSRSHKAEKTSEKSASRSGIAAVASDPPAPRNGGGGSGSRRESERPAAGEKPVAERVAERTSEKECAGSATQAAAAAEQPAAIERAEKEKAKPVPAAPRTSARHGGTSRGGDGLPEEVLTQIAQAKFEAQEDRLRDVARFAIALIRDYPKLSVADCMRRVGEVQKSLLKYEMQYIRAWECQERRRRAEIKNLEEGAARCRSEAEVEGEKIVELRQVVEKERLRRKRYEGYEEAAAEVNRKRTRTDSKAAIATTTEEIAQLRKSCKEFETLVDQRTQRAELLRGAVAELSADLQREQSLAAKVLEGSTAEGKAPTQARSATSSSDIVEVIL